MDWNTRKVNNIDSNPIDCFWAVGKVGHQPRLYTIIEQYPCEEDGYTIVNGSEPELYILFESLSGRRWTDTFEGEQDFNEWKYAERFGDYFFKDRGMFVRAYKTLDEAKARAIVQVKAIQNIIDSYSPQEEVEDEQ